MDKPAFEKVILNISRNFNSNKLNICDDKDIPWMNDEIKTLIKKKTGCNKDRRDLIT